VRRVTKKIEVPIIGKGWRRGNKDSRRQRVLWADKAKLSIARVNAGMNEPARSCTCPYNDVGKSFAPALTKVPFPR
jgi:hypothetical protein